MIVTHNGEIEHMADRVVKLRDGMIRKNYNNDDMIPVIELVWSVLYNEESCEL